MSPAQVKQVAAYLAFLAFSPFSRAAVAEPVASPYLSMPVAEVIEHFRGQGYPFAYSTNLVPDDLLVLVEPVSKNPLDIVREILKPHALMLKQSDGIYLVIREVHGPPAVETGTVLLIIRNKESSLLEVPVVISGNPGLPAVETLGPGTYQIKHLSPGSHDLEISAAGHITVRRTAVLAAGDTVTLSIKMDPALAELDALNVFASRYILFSNSQFFVDQRAIQNLPGNGEDPIRSVHRLPGTAAGGWSAQTHIRGGEENESAIFLNGLRLLDPFHIRDFHNVFSSIDSRAISGVEAYTGGFPATYGDAMSGLILLQSQKPAKPRSHELGVSIFNTSFLTSGYSDGGRLDWLLSARRSNLGYIIDRKEHGDPDYNDMFSTLGFNYSSNTRFTFNALRASDQILAITEHLPSEREQSTSDTLNQHFWIQMEQSISSATDFTAVFSSSSFRNTRNALANDPEQLQATVMDDRKVEVYGIRADISHHANDRHRLLFGFEASKESARYNYFSEANYDGFYLAYPGVPESLERNIVLAPSGESYAAYLSDRWQLTSKLVIDSGLRWDKQTYIGPGNDDQFSPRFNLLYQFKSNIDLRLTWGRYYQSQQIQQLQVEDGVEHFFPAQQADHFIIGSSIRFNKNWSFRLEAFDKKYSSLRPRFENQLDPVPLIAELEPDRIQVAPTLGRARGAEFTIEFDGRHALNGWASYTLSRITDRIGSTSQPRNWDQRHSFQAGLAWSAKQWEFGLAAKIHSGWPTTAASLIRDEEGELKLEYGPRNAQNLASFANVDFRVSRIWQLPKSKLTAYFEISNLLDYQNECCVDYDVENDDEELPLLERSVDHWLGISPAIGVLWEF